MQSIKRRAGLDTGTFDVVLLGGVISLYIDEPTCSGEPLRANINDYRPSPNRPRPYAW